MTNFINSFANFQTFGLLKAKPVTTPKAIEVQDTAVQQAAAETARKRKTTRGYASTILGDLSQSTSTSGLKTTLGS